MHQFPLHSEHKQMPHSIHTIEYYVHQQWLFKQLDGIAEKILDAI
jgi:hypothetical protein